MRIYLPSKSLKQKINEERRLAAQAALRQWHPVFKIIARLSDEDVRLFETVERRFLPDVRAFEYRKVQAAAQAS